MKTLVCGFRFLLFFVFVFRPCYFSLVYIFFLLFSLGYVFIFDPLTSSHHDSNKRVGQHSNSLSSSCASDSWIIRCYGPLSLTSARGGFVLDSLRIDPLTRTRKNLSGHQRSRSQDKISKSPLTLSNVSLVGTSCGVLFTPN